LEEIKRDHLKVMQDLVIDILKALASPNMEIRRKTLNIALDLVTPQNIGEVIQVLKKEINLTQTQAFDQVLIHA
jgi:coatomer subunit beta